MTVSAVASLVRGWVDLYTNGLAPDVRAARRDEVEDDLWCQQEEAIAIGRSLPSLNLEMFLRLLLGVPADISWRFSHRRGAGAPARQRRSSMATRVIGALAMAGGTSWLVSALYALTAGPSEGEGDLFLVSFLGALAFAGALVGLTWRFQDHLTPAGGLMGVAAGISVAVGLLGGFVVFLPLFAIGSAWLVSELGRAGILSRRQSIVHVVSAAGVLVVLVMILVDWRLMSNGPFIVLVIPYLVSWVAIGADVLRGVPDVPVAREGKP